MPYLTPDSLPPTTRGRLFFVPDDVQWLALLSGAIAELARQPNWEQSPNGLTPEETVQAMREMLMSSRALEDYPVAAYYPTTPLAIPHDSATILDFDEDIIDTHNGQQYSPTWEYAVPADGYYRVASFIMFRISSPVLSGSYVTLNVQRNNVTQGVIGRQQGFSLNTDYRLGGEMIVACSAGQTLRIASYQNTGQAITLLGLPSPSHYAQVAIERIA